jgi:hypothetical protein
MVISGRLLAAIAISFVLRLSGHDIMRGRFFVTAPWRECQGMSEGGYGLSDIPGVGRGFAPTWLNPLNL